MSCKQAPAPPFLTSIASVTQTAIYFGGIPVIISGVGYYQIHSIPSAWEENWKRLISYGIECLPRYYSSFVGIGHSSPPASFLH